MSGLACVYKSDPLATILMCNSEKKNTSQSVSRKMVINFVSSSLRHREISVTMTIPTQAYSSNTDGNGFESKVIITFPHQTLCFHVSYLESSSGEQKNDDHPTHPSSGSYDNEGIANLVGFLAIDL